MSRFHKRGGGNLVKIPTRVVRCSRDETLRAKNVSAQPGCGKFVSQRKIPRPKERGIGAGDRGRTGTLLSQHWILSPRRLPVPPHRLGKRNAQPFFHCLYIISSRAVFVKCFFIFFTALRLFSCDILRLLCLFTFVRQYFNKCTTLLCYNRHNERVSSAAAAAVERFLT